MRKICLEILDMIKDVVKAILYLCFVGMVISLFRLSFYETDFVLILYDIAICGIILCISYISYKNNNERRYQEKINKVFSFVMPVFMLMTSMVYYLYWPMFKISFLCMFLREEMNGACG